VCSAPQRPFSASTREVDLPRLKTTRICVRCSQPFVPTWHGQPPQRFCSRPCYWKAMVRPVIDRFIEFIEVAANGCWIWTGPRDKDGYGLFAVHRHNIRAHRFVWTLAFGAIPKGLGVLHRCDTPSCVRPECLFLGTNLDNQRDCTQKGRKPHGTKHWKAKLTAEDVRFIRASPLSSRQIAPRFGVAHMHIRKIRQRKSWKHLR